MKTNKHLVSLAAAIACVASLPAAGLKSPLQSLPGETIAAIRFDNRPEVMDRYVETTKMGQLLFSEDKIAEYKAFIQNLIDEDEKAAAFVEKLRSFGLELDDLYALFSSELGAAVVQKEVEGFSPMPTLLFWADMDPDVANRVYAAILKATGEKDTLERTDQELAGISASRIRNREKGDSFLIAQLETRFLFAIGFPVDIEGVTADDAVRFEDAEWEALGYFIEAQKGAGGSFLADFYDDAGVGAIRPSYETRLEVLGNLNKLLEYVPATAAPALEALEISQFNKLAIWSGLVDMEERSLVFLGVPTPRRGLATLVENDVFEFRPPAWVPASSNTYSSVSFDLARAYGVILDIAKKFGDPVMIDQNVAMADQQLQATLQTDIATLLSSFGEVFHMVEFPIEISTVEFMGESSEVPRAPQVFVMDFSKPEVLEAALGMAQSMASNPDSTLQFIEEQGFKGIRMPSPQGEITVAFGSGKLIMATGSADVATRIFSALNNPPEGEDALINDPRLRAFLTSRSPKPGLAFSYAQGDQVLANLIPVFKMLGETMQAKSEESASVIEELTALLPAEDELKGVLGVVFSRMYVNEHGLVIEGFNEYK